MQRVAHVLGEVDDGVAAQHEVVARRAGTASRSRSPVSKRVSAAARAWPASRRRRCGRTSASSWPAGRVRASSAREDARRGRASTMRASMSVPWISTRAPGTASRGRRRPACRPRRRRSSRRSSSGCGPRAASSGRIVARERAPLLRVAPQLRDVDRHAVEEGVELGRRRRRSSVQRSRRASRRAAALGEGADAALHLARACTGAGRCRQTRRTPSQKSR